MISTMCLLLLTLSDGSAVGVNADAAGWVAAADHDAGVQTAVIYDKGGRIDVRETVEEIGTMFWKACDIPVVPRPHEAFQSRR